jgi:hypothetical protein
MNASHGLTRLAVGGAITTTHSIKRQRFWRAFIRWIWR